MDAAQLRRTQGISQEAVRGVNALVRRVGDELPEPPARPAPGPSFSRPTVVVPARVRIGERVTLRLEAFPLPPGTRLRVFTASAAAGSGAGVELGSAEIASTGRGTLTVRWPSRYQFCGGASSCSSVPAVTGTNIVSAISASPQVSVTARTEVVR